MYVLQSEFELGALFKVPFEHKKILYSLNSDFFRTGNDLCNIGAQQLAIDLDEEQTYYKSLPEFPCGEMGCRTMFTTVHDYEIHCRSVHSFVCSACKRTFPTYNMLDVHIQEKHDSYHEAARDRNLAKFSCFVEGCDRTYLSSGERDAHVIKDHNFPSNFKFQPLKPAVLKLEDMEITADEGSLEASGASRPAKHRPQVPRNVCFGRGSGRAFKRGSSRKSNRDITMKELGDAL